MDKIKDFGKIITNGLFVLVFSAIGYGFNKVEHNEDVNQKQNERLIILEDDKEEDQGKLEKIISNQEKILERITAIEKKQYADK